ncbi:MAG: hypothetical protein HZY76_23130 [Anaerolineae bacterium]|nr:MAG: hypothetical protein HZY76_23130 [Anaerolineae bacterium]
MGKLALRQAQGERLRKGTGQTGGNPFALVFVSFGLSLSKPGNSPFDKLRANGCAKAQGERATIRSPWFSFRSD